MMGNEAIAFGAIRAGVGVVTGYPGTPSTEVLETIAKHNDNGHIYVEWSVNEKTAMEVAAGAAYAGQRTLVTMKQLDYAAVDANPGGNVWVMAHFIDHGAESGQFKLAISQNDEVRGMFMGHRHRRDIVYAGANYANKVIAQVGSFADTRDEEKIWGIRDLIITGKTAVSRHITAEIHKGQINTAYKISAVVQYNEDGTTTVVPDNPDENIFEDMGRTGMNMQAGNYEERFDPQDLSSYKKLSFDLTFTVDVDFDNLSCTKSQFELTSSGGPDVNEWNWNMLEVLKAIGGTHKAGDKITVTLNMEDLKPETKPGDQTLDLEHVTYLRWYCKELQSPLAFDIGNFKFE